MQVASPSRERVEAYMQLRDEIELTVGRINGDFDTMGHTAIRYLHQAYPREEMVALFLAADVMLVTALRDGMNLVAKEYVATRVDNRGVLILSEFAGAADELGSALRINPHDIEGLKDAIMRAVDDAARQSRAAACGPPRRRVLEHDVEDWSREFLEALATFHREDKRDRHRRTSVQIDDEALHEALARVAASDRLLVALDFDGTLAPLEDEPMKARALPAAAAAVDALAALPDTPVAFVSGRSLHDLREIAEHADDAPDLPRRIARRRVLGPRRGRCSTPTTTRMRRRCATSCAIRWPRQRRADSRASGSSRRPSGSASTPASPTPEDARRPRNAADQLVQDARAALAPPHRAQHRRVRLPARGQGLRDRRAARADRRDRRAVRRRRRDRRGRAARASARTTSASASARARRPRRVRVRKHPGIGGRAEPAGAEPAGAGRPSRSRRRAE